MNRFQHLFQTSKHAFMPFFVLGYPTPEASLTLIKTAIDAGVDALELGFPFSDPIADGPVIQQATQTALSQGTTPSLCLELLRELRAYTEIPIGVMVYFNLLFNRGITRACEELAAAGVDAVLPVDVPLEEFDSLREHLADHDLGAVQFIAPNTPLDRAERLMEQATAFNYVIGDYGTTGMREALSLESLQRLKPLQRKDKPLVWGFGVSTPEHVQSVYAAGAQGVIVGSALVRLIAEHENDLNQAQQALTAFITACLQPK